MTVSFAGHIEADSEADAEQKAWTSWGETMDRPLTYDGVDDILVELDDDTWCEEHECHDYPVCCGEEEEE